MITVPSKPITYWNRREGREAVEKIYGDKALRWLYETGLGRLLTHSLLTRRWISKLVGFYQSTRGSRQRVPAFIDKFAVQMDEFVEEEYGCFNDFFCRRFRPRARQFCSEPNEISAFAEGRYLVFDEVTREQTFPVKGRFLSSAAILSRPDVAREFEGGPVVVARLCPVDYHRFHYPDSGKTRESYRLPGRLHSVNPIALAARGDIFMTNERRVSILETEGFGSLAYVEIGALNVGHIVQTHSEDEVFERGAEKGYFLFGGSTVILMGQRGRWKPDDDLLERTACEQEVLVRLGERIGTSRHFSPIPTAAP